MTHKYSVLTVKHASGSITWSRTLGLLFDYLIIVLRTRSLSFGGWPLLGSSFQFFGPHFGFELGHSRKPTYCVASYLCRAAQLFSSQCLVQIV